MPLSPLDIHNKEFDRSFRGYNEDQVNEFMEQVMKDMDLVLKEKSELEARLASAHDQLGHYSSLEDTLQKSIIVAQEAAEEVRRNSQKEAKLIVKEAEKNADRIVNEALAKARTVALEIEELKKHSKVFRNRFKMIVEAQLDLIDSEDWDHLMEYEIKVPDVDQVEAIELPDEE